MVTVVVLGDELVVEVEPDVGVCSRFFAAAEAVGVDCDECLVLVDGEPDVCLGCDLERACLYGCAQDGDDDKRPIESERDPVKLPCQLVRETDDADEAQAGER